jgi:hypothetical protein
MKQYGDASVPSGDPAALGQAAWSDEHRCAFWDGRTQGWRAHAASRWMRVRWDALVSAVTLVPPAQEVSRAACPRLVLDL